MVTSPEGGAVMSATAAARQQAVGPRHLARVELRLGLEAPLPGGLRGRKGLGVAQAQLLDLGHGHVRRLIVQTLLGPLLRGQGAGQIVYRGSHRPTSPTGSPAQAAHSSPAMISRKPEGATATVTLPPGSWSAGL